MYEIIEGIKKIKATVRLSGNGAHVYVPVEWEGATVEVTVISENKLPVED